MNTKRSYGKKLPQRYLQQAILKLLRRKPGKFYSVGNISSKLKAKNSKDAIKSALDALLHKERVIIDGQSKYSINPKQLDQAGVKVVTLQGKADITASGAAYIIVDGQEKDIYVPKKSVAGALQGDLVKVEVAYIGHRRPEGKITEIIKRKRTSFIGTFQDFKKYGYVFVETSKLSLEIRIQPKDYLNATGGEPVVVEITDFGQNKRQEILGRIVQVLSPANRNDYEMQTILVNNGFEITFGPETLAESEALHDHITPTDLDERRDFRNTLTFTIDPHNAKDFDDAISYRTLDGGLTEIGVHIADVTHFVKENSALDLEAYHRSTSVYLVDRVCPMLPEKISNELCSLRPNEDKFSFSAVFTFDEANQIVDEWFGKTLIHSDRRFTYEEAQEVLDEQSEELATELRHINAVAKHLNKHRFRNGSINFESDEIRFELDENGKPVGITRKVRKDANKLIEEFMLLANKRVAKYIHTKADGKEIPYVYRVHDLPDADRLMELALLASEFGIKLNMDTPQNITASLNSLSQDSEHAELLSVLRPMAIRTMAKAAYSSDNIGHYGLGFDFYSHFTSPIRRYSDVLAHRILYANLQGTKRVSKPDLEDKCRYISLKERDAITAERESIKYKQVEYLSSQVGNVLPGVIRSIIDKGMFIELIESQADGLIRFESFDEHLVIHPAKIKVTGQRSGQVWRIGDVINVTIVDVDMDKRQIDLQIADEDESKD
ncbi:MAG: ribonuclease R [Bacteroidota bacterium]